MPIFESSIQNKVRYGYYICLVLIIIISLLNYFNLKTIRKKIDFSFIISQFFDTALEMRRFEKNFFLYRDKYDYDENLRYTEMAEDILKRNRGAIEELSPHTDVSAMEGTIREYKALMERYYIRSKSKTADPADFYVLESRIREKGKRLVSETEVISVAERKYVQSLIISSKRFLLFAVAILVIVGWLTGRFFSFMVVRPLKRLEESMQRISDGKFDRLSFESKDREIISLNNAFSRMIKELELRQVRFILQSEKLACLGTMVSGVAHQLNNPLSNISSSCQILHEEIEDKDIEYKRELMRQIEREVDRAKTMVHSLLEFSRKKEFKSKPMALKVLVEDTIRLIRGDVPTKVEIVVNIPETIWIIADKQRIEQAIINIVKNGIDAIPDEGRVLLVAMEYPEEKTVVIRIEDTGVGIDEEVIRRIFDPFFTTKEEGKGSGLGLFVAREIIEEHEGSIEVESTAGKGTTFIIKLPVKEALCSGQGEDA